MSCSRRDLALMLPTILVSASLRAQEQSRLPSAVYVFHNLPIRHSNKLDYSPIVSGTTVEGCKVSVHESSLAPQSEPHPPHHHNGEEIFLMLEGTLEFTINGKTTRASEGSVLLAGSNDEHGIFNPESTHAKYFVLALGT